MHGGEDGGDVARDAAAGGLFSGCASGHDGDAEVLEGAVVDAASAG